jgi:CDP-diacylglycerol--glycerol-3-phosphate 3-phosphatidyltransferase
VAKGEPKMLKYQPFKPRDPSSFYSEPNIITLLRLGLSLTFFVMAIVHRSLTYNFIGLAIHWTGDVLDGFYARKFSQETIFGAEIDIIADRIAMFFFYINYLFFKPFLFLPITIYLLNFVYFDFYLSYQFVKYDIISVNYFYKVDKTIYRLNFSPVGKFCNSAVVTLILIFLTQLKLLAAVFAVGLIGVKIYSIYRLNLNSRGRILKLHTPQVSEDFKATQLILRAKLKGSKSNTEHEKIRTRNSLSI